MPPTLYVLVYPSRLFAAHWSLWLPYSNADGQESDIGDRIHVTGDRLNGFQYEYLREYNVREDDRKPKSFAIGLLSPTALSDTAEINAVNLFDKACQEVKAPGPSLNNVTTGERNRANDQPPKRVEAKDCQWWVKKAVAHLLGRGLLLPLGGGPESVSPAETVEELPLH